MATFRKGRGLTFDDVLLVPHYSTVRSRDEVSTHTRVGNIILSLPIISAPMDTITGMEMATAMAKAGGAGVLYRNIREIDQEVLGGVIPSVGLGEYQLGIASWWRKEHGQLAICLDVAHGYNGEVISTIRKLQALGFETIIAGNVATPEAFMSLWYAGANVIKVGIGPGSVCTTRIQTGHGVPQLTAIFECAKVMREFRENNREVYMIADGGCRNSGDIVKALAAGADAVMLGQLLAGCLEAPNLSVRESVKLYRGCAAASDENPMYVEGEEVFVPFKGPVAEELAKLMAGVRSGMSYSGARDLHELQEVAEFIEVSPSAVIENGAHVKKF